MGYPCRSRFALYVGEHGESLKIPVDVNSPSISYVTVISVPQKIIQLICINGAIQNAMKYLQLVTVTGRSIEDGVLRLGITRAGRRLENLPGQF
jgi:hypothetical protein